MSTKECVGVFLFSLGLELFAKIRKDLVPTHSGFLCGSFSRVAGARQSFQIFRQNTWFLESNRALSKFVYWILHYLVSIFKL